MEHIDISQLYLSPIDWWQLVFVKIEYKKSFKASISQQIALEGKLIEVLRSYKIEFHMGYFNAIPDFDKIDSDYEAANRDSNTTVAKLISSATTSGGSVEYFNDTLNHNFLFTF